MITAVNGESVSSRSDYCREVGKVSGETVKLSYYSRLDGWTDVYEDPVKFQ